jgi:hypothetical protein
MLLFVTIEIKSPRQFIGESRFIIDKGFDMDSCYSSIAQQDPKGWFSCTGFIFGDPGGLRGRLRT